MLSPMTRIDTLDLTSEEYDLLGSPQPGDTFVSWMTPAEVRIIGVVPAPPDGMTLLFSAVSEGA